MNNIVKLLSVAVALVAFASCETYKVGEPDMTAISNVDGKYVAFAISEGTIKDTTILAIVITNTTNNDPDKGWMTIADMNPKVTGSRNYLDAVRFQISINTETQAFSAKSVAATEPNTCWNPYREGSSGSGGYYTYAQNKKNFQNYTVSVEGSIKTNAINTATGGKADAITFSYSRTYPDQTTKTYTVSGMVKTGWGEDLQIYQDFIKAKAW